MLFDIDALREMWDNDTLPMQNIDAITLADILGSAIGSFDEATSETLIKAVQQHAYTIGDDDLDIHTALWSIAMLARAAAKLYQIYFGTATISAAQKAGVSFETAIAGMLEVTGMEP